MAFYSMNSTARVTIVLFLWPGESLLFYCPGDYRIMILLPGDYRIILLPG
jgi:hypothetical protein